MVWSRPQFLIRRDVIDAAIRERPLSTVVPERKHGPERGVHLATGVVIDGLGYFEQIQYFRPDLDRRPASPLTVLILANP
jgi:hypothetical protein